MHGELGTLARSGRKRKQGRRTASGDLARSPAINYRALAAMQPHRRWLPADKREDHRAATLLGSLNLLYRPATAYSSEQGITDQQAEAGRQYAVAVGRYRASIESPSGIAGAGRGYGCNPELCLSTDPEEKSEDCECFNRRSKYMALYEALAKSGRKATLAVNDCAIREQIVDIRALRRGLDALANHIGLTAGRKSVQTGN